MRGATPPLSPIRLHGVVLSQPQGQLYLYLTLKNTKDSWSPVGIQTGYLSNASQARYSSDNPLGRRTSHFRTFVAY
jgi:hypothetical protein